MDERHRFPGARQGGVREAGHVECRAMGEHRRRLDVAALVRPEEGRINRAVFTDPDVYELEQERIRWRC
jgi:hypothetical protein